MSLGGYTSSFFGILMKHKPGLFILLHAWGLEDMIWNNGKTGVRILTYILFASKFVQTRVYFNCNLLAQVRRRDERIRTGELPTTLVIPLTLAEKVAVEVNASLDKLTHEQYVSRNSNSYFSFVSYHIL